MAQQTQNLINQIEQLLNHGLQDINQVLPLLPQISHHLQSNHDNLNSLRAALAASQTHSERLNNVINTNNAVIANLETEKNNLLNELTRLKNELDKIQKVNNQIMEDFSNRIGERFRNELNANSSNMMGVLTLKFTNLEALLNSLKNEILIKIENCTNSLKNQIDKADHIKLLDYIRDILEASQKNINSLIVQLDKEKVSREINENNLLTRLGRLNQQYSGIDNNLNLMRIGLNNLQNDLGVEINKNIVKNGVNLSDNISRNLNSESNNVINTLVNFLNNKSSVQESYISNIGNKIGIISVIFEKKLTIFSIIFLILSIFIFLCFACFVS
jgi:chromosome segregation ATPase